MGKIIKCLRAFLQSLDFFPATQFLRYKGETEYKTATGGFVSFIIIIIFIILFTSTGLDMINKTTVTATSNFQNQFVPSLSNVTIGPAGDFTFAVHILGFNFSDPTYTAFEIILKQQDFTSPSKNTVSTEVPLQACTLDHFRYGTDFQSKFQFYNLTQWLCPPLNYQFQIQGKLTSSIRQQFSVYVKKCNVTRHNNCLSDAQINNLQNKYGSFNFLFLLINTQLNPSQSQDYRRQYVEDRNNFQFSTNLGVYAVPQVQQYQISSDDSIVPFTDQKVENGLIVTDVFTAYAIPVTNDAYVTVTFRKSPILASYNRTFQKIDDFFAYVGGLIGTVMGLFLIISSYNQLCYSISLGNKLFLYDKETKIDSDQFNIIYYICYLGYKICSFFGCLKNCAPMKIYEACSEELQKQLDISYLIRRIIFLQRAIFVIFDQNQLTSLHLQDQMTLDQAKQLREKFKVKNQLQKIFMPKSNEEKYKQTEQDFIQKDRVDKIAKQKRYQSQLSASSCQTIKSKSVSSLRAKVKTLLSQNQEGGIRNKKILANANPFLIQKMQQQRQQTNKDIDDKNSFEGMTSFIGDHYFREMQQKQNGKHKQQMQHYHQRKGDNDI